MKNPFKSFFVFVILITIMVLLGSCQTSSQGFNYRDHYKKSKSLSKKTTRVNKGNDLIHYRCTNRH